MQNHGRANGRLRSARGNGVSRVSKKAGVPVTQKRGVLFQSHSLGPLFLSCNFSGSGKIKPNFTIVLEVYYLQRFERSSNMRYKRERDLIVPYVVFKKFFSYLLLIRLLRNSFHFQKWKIF